MKALEITFWSCSTCTLENPMDVQLCEACEAWNPFWSDADESTSSDFALAIELAEQNALHLARLHAHANQQSGNVRVSNLAFVSSPAIPMHTQEDDMDFLDVSSDLSHDHRKEILEMHQRERGSHITKHDTLVCNQHNAFLVSRFDGAGNCEDMMIPDSVYNPLKEHFYGVLKDQRKGKRRSFGSPVKGKHLPAASGSQNAPSAGAASGEPSQSPSTTLSPLTPAQLLAESSLAQSPNHPIQQDVPKHTTVAETGAVDEATAPILEPAVVQTKESLSPAKQPKAAQKPRASPKRSPLSQTQPQPRHAAHPPTPRQESQQEASLTDTSQPANSPNYAELGCSNWQDVVEMMQNLRRDNRTLQNQVALLQTFAKTQVRRVDQLEQQLHQVRAD